MADFDAKSAKLSTIQSVQILGRYITYTYDTVGNLLTFNNGTSSHTYTYGDSDWKDLLTAVDGVALTYDGAGNPTSYYNGAAYTLSWFEGRHLLRVTIGEDATQYQYDPDGLRYIKYNADGTQVRYMIAEGRTIGERHYDADGKVTLNMRYIFDENGTVCGYSTSTDGTNWTDYYFVRNLQGDVLQVIRVADGVTVAVYTYDSWGNILTATGEQAEANPFRYRGYYYDGESGFYYLESRYYDPEVGRFINADTYMSTGQGFTGYDMFAYCGNNPICRSDVSGDKWITDFVKGAKEWLEEEKERVQRRSGKTKVKGGTLSGAFGVGGSVAVGITTDNKGNIGFILTTNGGGGMPSWGAGVFETQTNAPDIYHQAGLGTQTGGSLSVLGASIGADYNMLVNTEKNETYHGFTATVGVGAAIIPAELHGEVGNSWVWGINLYEIAIDILDWICPDEDE